MEEIPVVHLILPGKDLTGCCGKNPAELPENAHGTLNRALVTCPGVRVQGMTPMMEVD